MSNLKFFYPEGHEKHFQYGHPERPDRVEAIKKTLFDEGLLNNGRLLNPIHISESIKNNIHNPALYKHLENLSFSNRNQDSETFLTKLSYQLALNSAGGAASVAKYIHENDSKGFALCRPPGHHATPNQAMGFCLINNIAIAAEYLIQDKGLKKVAIIDLDVHHGNGTQDIFYNRSDVFFFSIHQSPLYPMSGYISEKGEDGGNGYTMNIPLPPYSGDKARIDSLEKLILPALSKYSPEIVLVSIGFDAHWKDQLSQQLTTVNNYAQTIQMLSAWADENCAGKIGLFLEGGYDLSVCSSVSLAVSQALLGNKWDDPLGTSNNRETDQWKPIIAKIQDEWDL